MYLDIGKYAVFVSSLFSFGETVYRVGKITDIYKTTENPGYVGDSVFYVIEAPTPYNPFSHSTKFHRSKDQIKVLTKEETVRYLLTNKLDEKDLFKLDPGIFSYEIRGQLVIL